MFTPLIQRQVLQTAAVEAVRASADGAALVQQEQARRQAFDAKLAEARAEVADVEATDVLRLTDREGKRQSSGQGTGAGSGGESPEEPGSAGGAGPHLNLLA